MRITEKYLRTIVREELLREGFGQTAQTSDPAVRQLMSLDRDLSRAPPAPRARSAAGELYDDLAPMVKDGFTSSDPVNAAKLLNLHIGKTFIMPIDGKTKDTIAYKDADVDFLFRDVQRDRYGRSWMFDDSPGTNAIILINYSTDLDGKFQFAKLNRILTPTAGSIKFSFITENGVKFQLTPEQVIAYLENIINMSKQLAVIRDKIDNSSIPWYYTPERDQLDLMIKAGYNKQTKRFPPTTRLIVSPADDALLVISLTPAVGLRQSF